MRPTNEAIRAFVSESNKIEGIEHTTKQDLDAHFALLSGKLTVSRIVEFVRQIQPGARFRSSPDVPGVRVGSHIPPPSGPDIESELRSILALFDPWEQHDS